MVPKLRRLAVLSAVVEHYINSGEPVSSKKLCESTELDVSPATFRNDMASLTEGGYLHQPHTSAGRVPTQRGFRLYVDTLMNRRTISEEIVRDIEVKLLSYSLDPSGFLTQATRMLSDMTGLAAFATNPVTDDAVITLAEIIPTAAHTCIVLLMITPSNLKSRICRVEIPLDERNVEVMRKVFAAKFCGKRLHEITKQFVESTVQSLGGYADIFRPIFLAAKEAADEGRKTVAELTGESRLLSSNAFSDSSLRSLLSFVSDDEKLTPLVCSLGGSLNVCIGSESGHDELKDASIVSAKYSSAGGASGWVGVIGPTRLNYARVIPCIEYFSTAVGKLMSTSENELCSFANQWN